MIRKFFFLLTICVFGISSIQAQEVWDLERCIRYAQENSFQVKQADISIQNSELTNKQSRLSRYPTLNGSGSYAFNFGRSIDPTTNQFESQTIQSNNWALQSGVVVYNGFQTKNSIKQSEFDIMAAKEDKNDIVNNLSLSVAQAYLQIMLVEDQITISKNRLQQTKDQMERTIKLINIGTLPASNKVDLEAQLASDEQVLIANENSLTLAYLSLKQLLNLDPYYDIRVDRPEVMVPVDGNPDNFTVDLLYAEALKSQPAILANEHRQKSSEIGVDIARGGLQPTVTAFGNLSTNYSNLGIRSTGTQSVQSYLGDLVLGSDTIPLNLENERQIFEKSPYFNQLTDNFSQAVGVSVNIPIFNGGRQRIAIQRAELGVLSSEYAAEQTKVQLKADIQRALTDAQGAMRQLEATEKALEAQQNAFENAEKRYKLGALSTYDYARAKDNMDIAKSNVVSSKYDYIFKLKVLDYYLGKNISF